MISYMTVYGPHEFYLHASRRSYLRYAFILLLQFFGPVQSFCQADSTGFGKTDKLNAGFKGEIFLLTGGTTKLPDFDTLKPVGTIYTPAINVAPQSWDAGFPGVTDRFEWFGIVYRGNFKPGSPGLYRFQLLSDDGSKLFIDDSLIINNDGIHAEASGFKDIELNASEHTIEVQYFQGPRMHLALQLFYARKDEQLKLFPGDDFILTTSAKKTAWLWWLIPLALLSIFLIYRYRKNKQPVKTKGSPPSTQAHGD